MSTTLLIGLTPIAVSRCFIQSGDSPILILDKVTPENAEFAKKSLEEWRSKQAKQKNNNKHKPQK